MPYSIPTSTKILIYFGNSTIFVYFSWHPLCLWICYGPRSIHFTVSPGRKGIFSFLHIQLHNHQKDLNPCLWLYYYDKFIIELEKNTNNKKRPTVHGACNLTKYNFKVVIYFWFPIIPEQFFLKGPLTNNFCHAYQILTIKETASPIPLFLTDKNKLDRIPSKIKWNVLWYIVF